MGARETGRVRDRQRQTESLVIMLYWTREESQGSRHPLTKMKTDQPEACSRSISNRVFGTVFFLLQWKLEVVQHVT